MDRYIGKLLDNRYEILEKIGSGGMADALMPCPAQHTAAKITTGKGCTIKSRTARMFT